MHKHSSSTDNHIKRQMVRTVPCPKCGAEANQKCIGVRVKARSASHKERWAAYRNQHNVGVN